MSQTKISGIVLSSINVGEYDKRITILTKEHGKVGAFLRGARRPKSELCSITPFATGDFYAFAGKEAFYIKESGRLEHFQDLMRDYDRACYGSYFLEVADYYSVEEGDERDRLLLLFYTLKALDAGRIDPKLIKDIYDLKTLVINGEYPNVFSCVLCGAKENLMGFSVKSKGCVCGACLNKEGVALNKSSIYALQFIVAKPMKELYTFSLSENCAKELAGIMHTYKKSYIDHKFKSEDFLS